MQAYKEQLPNDRALPYAAFINECGEPKKMVDAHWHDTYEVLFVRSGECEQRIALISESLGPGALVVIHPGDIHETRATSTGGCVIDVLQFMPDISDVTLPSCCIRAPQLRHTALAERFSNMRAFANLGDAASKLIVRGAIMELGGHILRDLPDEVKRLRSVTETIAMVCRYLEEDGEFSLAAAAARCGYAPEYLSRRFHAEMGVTFRAYCEQIRMRRALRIMRGGALSLSDIAEQMGYANESSFGRAFRRVFGMPPHRYLERRIPLSGE